MGQDLKTAEISPQVSQIFSRMSVGSRSGGWRLSISHAVAGCLWPLCSAAESKAETFRAPLPAE